ncbi:MAG: hypothetical protein WAM14_01200 [Candidatus Nitrosopolaris sp.]
MHSREAWTVCCVKLTFVVFVVDPFMGGGSDELGEKVEIESSLYCFGTWIAKTYGDSTTNDRIKAPNKDKAKNSLLFLSIIYTH